MSAPQLLGAVLSSLGYLNDGHAYPCPSCGRAPVVTGCDVFCEHCVDGAPDATQVFGSGKTRDDAIASWNEMVECYLDDVAARRARRTPLDRLPLTRLQSVAGEMAEVIESDAEQRLREYARLLEHQAHAEIEKRSTGRKQLHVR